MHDNLSGQSRRATQHGRCSHAWVTTHHDLQHIWTPAVAPPYRRRDPLIGRNLPVSFTCLRPCLFYVSPSVSLLRVSNPLLFSRNHSIHVFLFFKRQTAVARINGEKKASSRANCNRCRSSTCHYFNKYKASSRHLLLIIKFFFRINTQPVDTEKGYEWTVIVLTVKKKRRPSPLTNR